MPHDKRLSRSIGQALRRLRQQKGMEDWELAAILESDSVQESMKSKRVTFSRSFAIVLREHRERSGLSWDELADQADTERAYLEELATGVAEHVFFDTALQLAWALKTDAGDFLQEAWDRQEQVAN